MNKLGVKVYGDSVFEIDGVNYKVNSINYSTFKCDEYKFRIIKSKDFGIRLLKIRFI